MRLRYSTLLVGVMAGGCLVPRYDIDPLGTSSGGAANGGSATAGTAGAAGATGLDCGPEQKICDDECVDVDDVNYGCTDTSCNMSECPAAGSATLACDAGACVIGGCGAGSKKCDGKCVAISDPTYGCGDTSCDASGCPEPAAGTLVCEDGACAVGTCGADTKQCGNKCVPPDENNGCGDPSSCTACASFETCLGTPTACSCVGDDLEACKGKKCGTAVNNCGDMVTCANTCVAPASHCSDNNCVECNADADCPGPGSNVCARATCTDHKCGYTTAPNNTACPGGGLCSRTVPGICVRPAVTASDVSIDATEVTRGQYYEFIKAKGTDFSGQPSYCSWNNTFKPNFTSGEFKPAIKEYDYPVVAVDWCDAYAYCQWAGRRLCGKIGGGALATDDDEADPTKNQWLKACVGPSNFAYPYGDSFVEGRCNGPLGRSEGAVAPVASLPQCVGGYPGLYDMSGNASEWLDSCNAAESNSYCALRGGDWRVRGAGPLPTELSCGAGAGSARSAGDSSNGFRCCGP